MPCSDAGMDGYDTELLKQRLDVATRVACEACEQLNELKALHVLGNEANSWYERHKRDDAERIRSEAMAKLTAREKSVLGLLR